MSDFSLKGLNLPHVAVAPRIFGGDADTAGAWRRQQAFFERTLLQRLTDAGALVMGTCLPEDASLGADLACAYAANCDALVLQGGTNIIQTSACDASTNLDRSRDCFEIALVQAFGAADKPVLGICRGMQLINIALGGAIGAIADTDAVCHSNPSIYAANTHTVDFVADGYLSDLYRCPNGLVSSAHRQAVRVLGSSLRVEAVCSADGCIEAVRSTNHRYLVGVQWHPEFDAKADGRVDGSRLLRDFVSNAQAR